MSQEIQLYETYQATKRGLSEQEEAMIATERKVHELAEATYKDLRLILRSFSEPQEAFDYGRIMISRLEEDLSTELRHQRKKIQLDLEDNEQVYRKKLAQLD
ncbi:MULTISPECIES: hypothetical protein [Enterococcus]|uniref:Uncharacterized protein n=2 Tax=Enterococcus mundtii TaxID=53346 RepID=A0A2T5DA55_ENTMU|nr:hypothetical protein [Enterococcus mundtii]MBE6173490.1 hypothetical protein [Enterococcus faecium]MBO1084870.1 hypothetical protein [Enterococcus mundtii]MDB7101762.1 hypothetical protein [Enterococcus mundtii]MDV7745221.1 hypothetical protein [Enterococcus mundtii]OBS61860.1 hypothetical protein AX758_12055 [Enterococcus mundtii]